MAAPPAAAAVPIAAQPSGGGYLNLYGNAPVAPSAPSLLALKLLASTNNKAFEGLMEDQTKWLAAATALVRNDPYLRVSLGGDLLSASVTVADLLKKRAEEKHLHAHLDGVVDHLIAFENVETFKEKFSALGANKVLTINNHKIKFTAEGRGAALFDA